MRITRKGGLELAALGGHKQVAGAIRRGARTNPNARYEARYKQVKLQTMYVSIVVALFTER